MHSTMPMPMTMAAPAQKAEQLIEQVCAFSFIFRQASARCETALISAKSTKHIHNFGKNKKMWGSIFVSDYRPRVRPSLMRMLSLARL